MNDHRHARPVVVAICSSPEEALVLECLLTHEGFLCTTGDGVLDGSGSEAGTSIEILVSTAQADAARRLLATIRQAAFGTDEADESAATFRLVEARAS